MSEEEKSKEGQKFVSGTPKAGIFETSKQVPVETEAVLEALYAFQNEGEDTSVSDPAGAEALLERGWDLMVAAHGGNISTAMRSWVELARQWRADCHEWTEANASG